MMGGNGRPRIRMGIYPKCWDCIMYSIISSTIWLLAARGEQTTNRPDQRPVGGSVKATHDKEVLSRRGREEPPPAEL